MHLAAGQTLSCYEILGSVGAGAMGEVYRARDTRLEREVAIKILPEHFADDEERLRRFEREARSLASLNHPNVAQIHGVDQVGDTCFLVLEFVPGETLEERLARGPLPVAEAVEVCRQIAAGLEAAHEAGVIHRDLKPANVRITPDGRVKVLDFGLAKPSGPEAGEGSTADSVLATEEGRLLGTPTYMAPEQARGRAIDRRVDVWAFGCVLYECLTGTRAFAGETLSDVLACVLQEEPDWTRLPADTPAHVRALLERCLEKDARRRQRDMGDAWLELERADGAGTAASGGAGVARQRWIAVAGVVLALAAGTWLGSTLRGTPGAQRPRVTHSAVPQDAGRTWAPNDYASTFALSADGGSVVYCSQVDHGPRGKLDVLVLWKRSEPESSVLYEAPPGIRLECPFFSPDGAWVGFQADREGAPSELRRVSASRGGEAQVLCQVPGRVLFVAWGPGGELYFNVLGGGIFRVGETGAVEPVTTPEPGVEWMHKAPALLPGDGAMLFAIDYEGPRFDVVLEPRTGGEREVLVPGASWARFLPPGTLVYLLGEDLWADGFDPSPHRLAGTPVQLSERVQRGIPSSIDLAPDGTLVYAAPASGPKRSVRWVDRDGKVEDTGLPPEEDYAHVSIAPTGTRAVFGFGDGLYGGAVRVWDLARSRMDPPLVSELARQPTWAPDGEQVVWYSGEGGHLYRAAGSGGAVPEKGGLFECMPLAVLADGRVLHIAKVSEGGTGFDLFLTPFDRDQETDRVPLLVTGGDQLDAALSPDGKRLAYVTWRGVERAQVFVSPVPVTGPGVLVSPDGGAYPRWSGAGDELFYCDRDRLMRVGVTARGDGLAVSEPVQVYRGVSTTTTWPNRPFDVLPDGSRFLVLQDDAPAPRTELRLVTNLREEVRERMAARDR